MRCAAGAQMPSMRGNLCAIGVVRNFEARDNTRSGVAGMSPRALRWAVGLVVSYWAFLSLLAAVGQGWHL